MPESAEVKEVRSGYLEVLPAWVGWEVPIPAPSSPPLSLCIPSSGHHLALLLSLSLFLPHVCLSPSSSTRPPLTTGLTSPRPAFPTGRVHRSYSINPSILG